MLTFDGRANRAKQLGQLRQNAQISNGRQDEHAETVLPAVHVMPACPRERFIKNDARTYHRFFFFPQRDRVHLWRLLSTLDVRGGTRRRTGPLDHPFQQQQRPLWFYGFNAGEIGARVTLNSALQPSVEVRFGCFIRIETKSDRKQTAQFSPRCKPLYSIQRREKEILNY